MKTCEVHNDLITRAAVLSESVVRVYVQTAACGRPRYGKALLKYGAAVGRLVQEAAILGGESWRRAAYACRIAHLALAAQYLGAESTQDGGDVRLVQEAARLSRFLHSLADTYTVLAAEKASQPADGARRAVGAL